MSNIKVFAGPAEVASAAAAIFIESAHKSVKARGRFAVVLSGGTTPGLMFELLAKPTTLNKETWEKTHIFWGDERAVPPDHPDSNYRAAKEALLDRVPIPEKNIFRFPSELDPRLAASQYEGTLRSFFGLGEEANKGLPSGHLFDLVFLGMGGDGHTASLFPGTAALEETTRWAVGNYVEQLGTWRITLTVPVFNSARAVAFLVTGSGKKTRLKEVLESTLDPFALPAKFIDPEAGDLTWLVDEAAAELISGSPKVD